VNGDKELKLSEKEQNLTREIVSRLRQIPYGELTFTVFQQNKEPVRVEIKEGKESIKL